MEKTHEKPAIAMALNLITALVVAAMLDLTIFLAPGILFPQGRVGLWELDSLALEWTVISFVLLRVFKMNSGTTIVVSLLFGIARWYFSFQ